MEKSPFIKLMELEHTRSKRRVKQLNKMHEEVDKAYKEYKEKAKELSKEES